MARLTRFGDRRVTEDRFVRPERTRAPQSRSPPGRWCVKCSARHLRIAEIRAVFLSSVSVPRSLALGIVKRGAHDHGPADLPDSPVSRLLAASLQPVSARSTSAKSGRRSNGIGIASSASLSGPMMNPARTVWLSAWGARREVGVGGQHSKAFDTSRPLSPMIGNLTGLAGRLDDRRYSGLWSSTAADRNADHLGCPASTIRSELGRRRRTRGVQDRREILPDG